LCEPDTRLLLLRLGIHEVGASAVIAKLLAGCGGIGAADCLERLVPATVLIAGGEEGTHVEIPNRMWQTSHGTRTAMNQGAPGRAGVGPSLGTRQVNKEDMQPLC
jgi:hypothetical protein